MWALYALGVLFILAYIGDRQGRARYGDGYRFDGGVDR